MKIIFSVILVFVLVLTMPLTTAFADDEVPVNCDLNFGAVLPGVDVVDEDEITNSGQVAIATVNCDVNDLDSVMVTNHGSEVTLGDISVVLNPGLPGLPPFIQVVDFSGELDGTFTLYDVIGGVIGTGELEADVSGLLLMDGSGELVLHDPDGDGQLNVIAISETIVGEWTLEGNPIEGEGEFYITLLPGLFTLPIDFGPLVVGDTIETLTVDTVEFKDQGFTGEVEMDDDDDD